ncbi:diguanylate cyclase (GGDEF)-like protein [Krasilnikovia cinnamomea]|uniref:Diguanylate cyclase (GGDEF)-like protein n=1 Tax=Krasilnikovia cinnamomea TaxID=349313 RepID=A0A4Q7ZTE4_9ACTN|nr:GGDEF domain-containing protein [Krasilnikovia cinnamomea]RZU54141.1 diguanylate cyclase (GGDEF)-like protein [Krasilnikovia cinnamomea]
MDGSAPHGELSAALLVLEEQPIADADAALATASALQARAAALGDAALEVRARLVRVTLRLRTGDIGGVAREVFEIHEWATRHGDRLLQARSHMACAQVARLSGDAAKHLEHAVSAVELLDETVAPDIQVTHRTKLADALAQTGAIDAARLRYRQAAELARTAGQWQRLMLVLNNWAFAEYDNGDAARAEEVVGRLLAHAEAHGLELNPRDLDTIAWIQIANGEYAEAERAMRLCIARREAGLSDGADDMAEYLVTLARAQRGLGELAQAQQSLDASRALCVDLGLPEVMVRVLQEQSELLAVRGEFAAAFAARKESFAAHERLRSREREAQAQARQELFATTEARQEAVRFREQARRDPLTRLRNRRFVDEELPAMIAADPGLVVAIADVDHFKRINDELSHDTGDQVLVNVSRLLEDGLAAVAPEGFVARLGGEEFLLVLPATPVRVAAARLDALRRAIAEHDWTAVTGGLPVTVSVGVGDPSPSSPSAALSTADRNLYAAKRAGRNRVVTGTPRDDVTSPAYAASSGP